MLLPEWNFSIQEYGDSWRKGRRIFHSGAHQGIVPKYESLQMRSSRKFLKTLNEDSSDLHEAVRK